MTRTTTPSDRTSGTVYGPRSATTWLPSTVAVVVGAGLALGVATHVLQGVLPDSFGRLADSGAVWAVFAFAIGSFVPRGVRDTAAAGAGTLLAALVGYCATALFTGALPAGTAGWAATALIGGPVFGVAGGWLRDEASWLVGEVPWRRISALAALGGVLVADGLTGVFIHPTGNPGGIDAVAWLMLLAGPAVPLLAGRTSRERTLASLALPLAVVAGLGALAAANFN